MTEQTNLGQLEIGTKEQEKAKLEPKKVKIVSYKTEPVEKAHADKIVFEVKHPDRDEPIRLSAVSSLAGKQVVTTGTWLNIDSEGKIVKNSALANLLVRLGAKNLDETKDKEIDTEEGDKGFLVFKAY